MIIYFAALLGGNAWALLENRTKPSYRALGASGATSGIVMSFILFRPFEPLMIFPIPFFMPAVVLGIVFVVGSAILAQRENKTHRARSASWRRAGRHSGDDCGATRGAEQFL